MRDAKYSAGILFLLLLITFVVLWIRNSSGPIKINLRFKNVSQPAGILDRALTYGNPAVADFNGDGFLDFLIGNHTLPARLYRNNGNGTFAETILSSGIDFLHRDRHGTSWGDFDNDGDVDLYVAVGADRGREVGTKKNQLWLNDGKGDFVNISDQAHVADAAGRSRSASWVDYDNDGYLDLFVKNFKSSNALYHNNKNGTFTDLAASSGLLNAPGVVSVWGDYDNDGDMDVFITGAAPDHDGLWRNDHGRFTDVTSDSKLQAAKFGVAASWGDYNNDGYLDLYITRRIHDEGNILYTTNNTIAFIDDEPIADGIDFVAGDRIVFDLFYESCHRRNRVFIGSGKKRPPSMPFVIDAAAASGKPAYLPGKDDGYFIWSDANAWHIRWSGRTQEWINFAGKISESTFQSIKSLHLIEQKGNASGQLFRNNHDGTFTDVTNELDAGVAGNGRAVTWGDFDNDGFLDLYIMDAGNILHNGEDRLLLNEGGKRFRDATSGTGLFPPSDGRGDGVSAFDYNNDGKLDLLLTNGAYYRLLASSNNCLPLGPYQLFRNDSSAGHWLEIKLLGSRSNRSGIGARVVLQAGDLRIMRQADGGTSQFYSQGAAPLHFGLGDHRQIDSLTIYWPDGQQQNIFHITANQMLTITEK